MEETKNIKRLILDIDKKFHIDIKVRASLKNISMKDWVLQAIFEKISKEKQVD